MAPKLGSQGFLAWRETTSGGGLQTSMTWNTYNAPLTAVGPNSDTMSFSYDAYARPSTRTEANGAVTTLTYSTSPHFTLATAGTRWTKSYPDGFGRTKKVETGYNTGVTPTTVSTVQTLYAPCACTPGGEIMEDVDAVRAGRNGLLDRAHL